VLLYTLTKIYSLKAGHFLINLFFCKTEGKYIVSDMYRFAPSSTSQLVRPGLSDATDRKHSIHNSHSSVSGSLSVTKDVSNETIAGMQANV